MLKKTDYFAETTTLLPDLDVLSDVLRAMRIKGSLLLMEEYVSPWAVAVPDGSELAGRLGIHSSTRVAAFHLVQRGHIELTLSTGENALVQAGEMAVCFAGTAHRLSHGTNAPTIPFETIMGAEGNPFQPHDTNRDRSTSLICGIFLLHDTLLNPLFTSLPSFLHASMSRIDGLPSLFGVANLLVQEVNHNEPGSHYHVERLLELLCAEAIRSYLKRTSEKSIGWVSGLRDPVVGQAIALIHASPGANWTVKNLASKVAISPSRFAARFTATLGESPMAYVTKWRLHVATSLLDNTEWSIEQIASNVGYESLAAFSRTFKRHLGLPPITWRAQRRV